MVNYHWRVTDTMGSIMGNYQDKSELQSHLGSGATYIVLDDETMRIIHPVAPGNPMVARRVLSDEYNEEWAMRMLATTSMHYMTAEQARFWQGCESTDPMIGESYAGDWTIVLDGRHLTLRPEDGSSQSLTFSLVSE